MVLSDIDEVAFVCPVFVTGGTEAIHQASMVFNDLGMRSSIVFVGGGAQVGRQGDTLFCSPSPANPCLSAFSQYRPMVADTVELTSRTLVVVPEIYALTGSDFRPARFAVWWLSVDNALGQNPSLRDPAGAAALFADPNVVHLFQSHYARSFLHRNRARQMAQLTDFTNRIFTAATPTAPARGRKIMVNPKKGLDLSTRFFGLNPNLQPLSIDGYGKQDMLRLFHENAIYVDFGSLPGKDRIPREAAACGAITFLHDVGAGREIVDFPIPDDFRFDAADIETGALAARIRAVLANPDAAWASQAVFRQEVFWEEAAFTTEARKLLGQHHPATSALWPVSRPLQAVRGP